MSTQNLEKNCLERTEHKQNYSEDQVECEYRNVIHSSGDLKTDFFNVVERFSQFVIMEQGGIPAVSPGDLEKMIVLCSGKNYTKASRIFLKTNLQIGDINGDMFKMGIKILVSPILQKGNNDYYFFLESLWGKSYGSIKVTC